MPHVSRQLCDDGFVIDFDANHVYLRKGKLLILGTRYPTLVLYYIDFNEPTYTTHVVNPTDLTLSPIAGKIEARAYFAHHMTTKSDLLQYLHRSAWSLLTSTWIKAIERGYYESWPGLTTELVRKHLPKIIHIAKGHIHQEHKNLRSTKQIITPSVIPSVMTVPNPIPEGVGVRENMVFIRILPISGKIYSNQTGRFPVTYSRSIK